VINQQLSIFSQTDHRLSNKLTNIDSCRHNKIRYFSS
jgi:hypothetical protein